MAGKGTSVGGVTIIVGANASQMFGEFARAQNGIQSFTSSVNTLGGSSAGFKMLGGAANSAGTSLLKMAAAGAAGGIAAGAVTAGIGLAAAGASAGLDAIGAVGHKMVEVGADSIKLAADMEQSRAAFDVLAGSADKGRAAIEGLQKLAVDTPFASKDLIGYGKSLLGMGANAEQLTPILGRLGDVAMGNSETLGRLVLQFGQVMNSGSFKKEEFNVFAEAGADVQAFARAAGTDMAGLNAMFQRGEVGAKVMVDGFNAMTSAGGRFHNMNATMSGTTLGAWNAFTEKIDLLKIKLGSSFIAGFKPSQLLESLSSSFGGIDQLEGKLTAFFGNARKIFDSLAAGAMAFASTVGTRLGGAFDALNTDGTWKSLEQIADSVMVSILTGFDSVMNKLGEFRSSFKETLLIAGQAAKMLSPGGSVGSMVAPAVMMAGGPMLEVLGGSKMLFQAQGAIGGIGGLLEQLGNAVGQNGRVLDSVGEYRKQLAAIRKPVAGDGGPGVGLIVNAPPGMSKAASEYLAGAAKPMDQFAEFRKSAMLANEVARFGTAQQSDAAYTRLATGFLDLERGFLNNMEVKLPSAMAAGSQEAASVITKAMSGQDRSPINRVATLMEQMKASDERRERFLADIKAELRNPRTQLVSFN
jgi:tape measure domain-containing protein